MQLDLFLDGREALLVNDLVARLLESSPEGAAGALDRLREESPDHPDLGAFDRLVRPLRAGPPAPPGAGQLRPMVERLATLAPAAGRLLGRAAAAFLLPWWRALARTEVVPAPAEPAPLLRHWIGCAHSHLGNEREAFRLWLPLCWLDPESFARRAPTLPSRIAREAWATFDSEADREETADARVQHVPWFPAWLALRHRWVAHLFRADEVPETEAPLRALRLNPTFFRAYRQLVVEARRPAT